MENQPPFITAFWVCAGLIGIGLLPMPYGYYMLLRLALFGVCAWGVVLLYRRHAGLAAGLGIGVLLYNPVFPIHLGAKAPWVVLNLVTLALLFVASKQLAPPVRPQATEKSDEE
ncbi:MAG: hypothetical protein AMS22_12360 [Thiotrichales bacterium SG8_50]|nr:MAG: hypothetical protein AMS22_12360 [Thiotrichales bacterium SG8_50]